METTANRNRGGLTDRSSTVRHAYVHVPFCPQICPFCPFHVTRRAPGVVAEYLARLDREAAEIAERYDVALDTLYLGGGTPSSLRPQEVEQLLDSLRRRFGPLGSEVTIEIHPSTANAGRLAEWRDLGITRFSIGLESTDDATLARLGRAHSAADGLSLAAAAVELGLDVSVDLITAVEEQDVERELVTVASLGVDHVSAYTLTIEEGTPFARDGVAVDPDDEARSFDLAGSVLGATGLERYEVSNHARPDHECRHNLAYWRSDWWLGLGPSAAAHLPSSPNPSFVLQDDASMRRSAAQNGVAVRAVNPTLDRWLAGDEPEVELLDGAGFALDAMIAGLRMTAGVDLDEIGGRAGFDVGVAYRHGIERLRLVGLVEREGSILRATPRGMAVLDHILAALVK